MEEPNEIKIDLSDEQLKKLIGLTKRMIKKAKLLKLDLSRTQIKKIALDQLGYSSYEQARKNERNEFGTFKDALRHQYDQF